jgi:hypothetical protein
MYPISLVQDLFSQTALCSDPTFIELVRIDPPRQLRPRTVTVTRDDNRPENVSATA